MNARFAVHALVTLTALTTLGADEARGQVTVEAQIATAVVDRMPEGSGTTFPADVGELYCWTRVTDGGGTTLQHVWIYNGEEQSVSLAIGGSPWRTWSSKTIPADWTGDWRVEIRDADGNVLETLSFTVG